MFFNYKPNLSSSCFNRIKSCFQDWISPKKKVLNWLSKRFNSTSVYCVYVCVFSVLIKSHFYWKQIARSEEDDGRKREDGGADAEPDVQRRRENRQAGGHNSI